MHTHTNPQTDRGNREKEGKKAMIEKKKKKWEEMGKMPFKSVKCEGAITHSRKSN